MYLLYYLSFYSVALPGGAARCASTIMSNLQLSILNCQLLHGSPRWRKTNSTWRGVNTRCPSLYPVSVNSFFKD